MMQHQFWVTKKSVLRKLGSREDECVVASDAELDAKLELFRSITESCLQLQKIIDIYQERVCIAAQEENVLGRYLKECGKAERNADIGKAITAAGKAITYVSHQRLTIRPPLVRLHHEVETFRMRAITDTRGTINVMEKSRTDYRAALEWMKFASQNLDPETHGLMNFRKAQSQVRASKAAFDKLKLACLQKIDLLAAARCNMFSHALVLYENATLTFSTKAESVLAGSLEKVRTVAKRDEIVPDGAIDADQKTFFNAEYNDGANECAETAEVVSETLVDVDESKPVESSLVSVLETTTRDVLDTPNYWSANEASDGCVDIRADLESIFAYDTATESNVFDSTQQFMPSQLLTITNNNDEKRDGRKARVKDRDERTSWLELFSDLDPLSQASAVEDVTDFYASA